RWRGAGPAAGLERPAALACLAVDCDIARLIEDALYEDLPISGGPARTSRLAFQVGTLSLKSRLISRCIGGEIVPPDHLARGLRKRVADAVVGRRKDAIANGQRRGFIGAVLDQMLPDQFAVIAANGGEAQPG